MDNYREKVETASSWLTSRLGVRPDIGIVLGSGLGVVADSIESSLIVPYEEIPGWPRSTAPGHFGRLVAGTIRGKHVICMQGRVHGYEGYSPKEITFPIQVLKAIGVTVLFLTNASGSVNLSIEPGEIVCVTDHINFSGSNPLTGQEIVNDAKRFPDMTHVYDVRLAETVRRCAESEGIQMKNGVYMIFTGPSYETPAEIRMARIMGADLVGMSTVPEAIVANAVGIRVCALSCVSNYAAGITGEMLTEEEVLDSMKRVATVLSTILTRAVGVL